MSPAQSQKSKKQSNPKGSSTAIGDRFENQVYHLFCAELKARRLFLDPATSVVFRKKKYWSRDREDNIVVDISIESTIPGATEFSVLTAIECKKYSRLVPVDDVEEFYSKLRQIAGANVKGILVSNSGFQEGAVKFARANRIALIRMVKNKGFNWVLNRAATGSVPYDQVDVFYSSIYQALTQKRYASDNIDFFASCEDVFTNSAWNLLHTLHESIKNDPTLASLWLQPNKERHRIVQYLALDAIDSAASRVLEQTGYTGGEVNIESICQSIAQDNGFSIEFVNTIGQDNLGSEILGEMVFLQRKVRIARMPHFGVFSRKFTVAHELGHILLDHGQFLKREVFSDDQLSTADDEIHPAASRFPNVADINRLEWQANHFAAALLLPRRAFERAYKALIDKLALKNRGHGILYLDDQLCNRNAYMQLSGKLRDHFRVSRKVIEIRLKDLKVLNDQRKFPQPIGRLIAGDSAA